MAHYPGLKAAERSQGLSEGKQPEDTGPYGSPERYVVIRLDCIHTK